MKRDYASLPATEMRRTDRLTTDPAWLESFLDRASTGMLATSVNGQPFININTFVYIPARHAIYLHTAHAGRTRNNISKNAKVCFSAADIGRLLPAKRAKNFSVEYSGATIFGRGEVVADESEAREALQALLDKYFPHLIPGQDYCTTTDKELAETSVFRIKIESWSGKVKRERDDFQGAFRFGERTVVPSRPGSDSATEPMLPRHTVRPVRFLEHFESDGWRVKLYGIREGSSKPDTTLVAIAKDLAQRALPQPAESDQRYGVAFVIIHQAEMFNQIIIDWWERVNELRHHVFKAKAETPTSFENITATGEAFCVWELRVLAFEREAWLQTALNGESNGQLKTYLAQTLNEDA